MISIHSFHGDLRSDNYICTYLDLKLNYHASVFNVNVVVLAFRKVNSHLPKHEEKEALFNIEKTVFFILKFWTKCKIIHFHKYGNSYKCLKLVPVPFLNLSY